MYDVIHMADYYNCIYIVTLVDNNNKYIRLTLHPFRSYNLLNNHIL